MCRDWPAIGLTVAQAVWMAITPELLRFPKRPQISASCIQRSRPAKNAAGLREKPAAERREAAEPEPPPPHKRAAEPADGAFCDPIKKIRKVARPVVATRVRPAHLGARAPRPARLLCTGAAHITGVH